MIEITRPSEAVDRTRSSDNPNPIPGHSNVFGANVFIGAGERAYNIILLHPKPDTLNLKI